MPLLTCNMVRNLMLENVKTLTTTIRSTVLDTSATQGRKTTQTNTIPYKKVTNCNTASSTQSFVTCNLDNTVLTSIHKYSFANLHGISLLKNQETS